jgi:hypothetical protein
LGCRASVGKRWGTVGSWELGGSAIRIKLYSTVLGVGRDLGTRISYSR